MNMAAKTNILLETGTNELEVVEFILNFKDRQGTTASQSFGINVAKVREIIRMPALTKLPKLHDVVCGIFNLRGHIIPSIDLCKYLYQSSEIDSGNKMIITEFNKIRAGFIVNDVHRIHRISWSDITTPEMIHDLDPEKSCIVGLIKFEGRNILMLDVEKIVADIDPASAIDKSSIPVHFKDKPIAFTAEDSPTIRRMISDRLNSAGFEIVSFKDGLEAWERMQEISSLISGGDNYKKYL
ncbi:MAG: two-component system, chemotaxis family, chemotaxis protein CheV, partial [Bacteroidota bacterium]|nr:two-component system, chemotaxis family, chemotaxis protein CheV [Bacteroidota bacterium]